ncbi:MAG: ATP-binding protein, partial [Thiohalospira sp.]
AASALQGVEGRFVVEADGAGWRVLAETGRSLRLAAAARLPATPLVDREVALDRIKATWRAACAGRGGSLVLRGEPGMGKTRLLLAFREQLRADAAPVVRELVCDPADRHHPLSPIVAHLRQLLPVHGGSVRALVESLGVVAGPGVVGELQGLVDGDGGRLTSAAQRTALLDLLAEVVAALADQQPSVWILDDLQWMDPTSRELLDRLVRVARGRPLFLLMAARTDGYRPRGVDEVVDLGPLSEQAARTLLRAVAGPREPAEEERLLQMAGGNPLYLEEVGRQAVTHGAGVPGGLRDLLAASVDALGDDRPLARLTAVAGHAFPRSLILAAEPGATTGLERLVAAGLLLREGREGYHFRHALLREAILDSLPRSEHRALAARLAAVLREELPERAAADPARLADYHEAAGEPLLAARSRRDAARQALARLAKVEAAHHLRRGVALLEGGEDPEAQALARELDRQLAALGEDYCPAASVG